MTKTRTQKCRRCRAPLEDGARYCIACGTLHGGVEASYDSHRNDRAAGWYDDPFGRFALRYWNGEIWTEGVWRDGEMLDVIHPDFSQPPRPTILQHGSPKRLLLLTIAGLIIAFALSLLVALVDVWLHRPGGQLVTLVVSELGLWTGLGSTCVLASRRFASGKLRVDYNISFRWVDPAIALAGALGGHALTGAIDAVLNAVHHQGGGNPDQVIYRIVAIPTLGWIVLVLLTCLGAPFFEELFFRGLLQGQLIQRYGVGIGLVVTAVVFGACHIANAPGWEGVFYGISIVGGGLALGLVRHLTGRLGASMTTHCFFNGIAVAALAITLATH